MTTIKQKISLFIHLLVGLIFMNAGLNKFLNYMPVPDDLPEKMMQMEAAIMEIGWLFPLVAVAEIVGGILFIIPQSRPFGAIILFPIMIGIVLTHTSAVPSGLPFALILLALILWVIVDNRAKYLPLITK